MHLGKEQATGIAADLDDVPATAEAAAAPDGGQRRYQAAGAPGDDECEHVPGAAPMPATAERPAGTGAR